MITLALTLIIGPRREFVLKSVHVVAAVIFSADRTSILIAKRPKHLHQGGLWEFPGGKLEEHEAPIDALTRELMEELNIKLVEAKPLLLVSHDYPDKSVILDVWDVSSFTGNCEGMEGQEVRWVKREASSLLEFPEANYPILEKIFQTP